MEGIRPWIIIMMVAMSNSLLLFVQAEKNAFGSDINQCLFDGWRTPQSSVLSSKVRCNAHKLVGLCYGLNNQRNRRTAAFVVCYNKNTLIPEFSAHVVVPGICGTAGREAFRNEAGVYAPHPQSDQRNDYEPSSQKQLVQNFNTQQENFYARGHLTPNGAFSTDEERGLTMVNTNIAPQWQLFNSQNWAVLERAVTSYSAQTERRVYVFTGTGGSLTRIQGGQPVPLELNSRVLVPQYFWKAVCDPRARRSVVFVAQNPTGANPGDEQKENGCHLNIEEQNFRQPLMTRGKGIIKCYSLDGLRNRKEARYFMLPPFSDNCNPSVRGDFLDEYLRQWN